MTTRTQKIRMRELHHVFIVVGAPDLFRQVISAITIEKPHTNTVDGANPALPTRRNRP